MLQRPEAGGDVIWEVVGTSRGISRHPPRYLLVTIEEKNKKQRKFRW